MLCGLFARREIFKETKIMKNNNNKNLDNNMCNRVSNNLKKGVLKILTVFVAVISAVVVLGFTFYGCAEKGKNANVDLDLSVMSGTVVYAEVYNMVYSPDRYLGKTIRVKGKYASNYYELTDKVYSYVVVSDATACCAQGLEVNLNGKWNFADGEEVIVTGVFSSYSELGKTYYEIIADYAERA